MLSKTIIAAGALLSMAAAVPLQQQNKRDVVWETRTTWDYTTVDVTTTVWLAPGETAPGETAPAGSAAPAAAPTHFGHKHKHPKPPPKQPSQPPAAPSQPSAASSPPAQSPSSPYSPPPASTPAPAPTTSQAPAPQPSQPSGGSPSGQTYTGDITHYAVGLGSCGYTNTDSQNIVAIPVGMMNNPANPNSNPLCGKTITIEYAGQTHTAEIVDTCEGCAGASIDLSPSLFKAVAPNGNGRVHGVKWWYNN